jgi:hypothetical protein
MNMNARTWNLNLMATDDRPATTIEGVSQKDAAKILRGLMHGPSSIEYVHVEDAIAAARVGVDRHEAPLAA